MTHTKIVMLRALLSGGFILLYLFSIFLIETEYKFYLFAAWSLFLAAVGWLLPPPQLTTVYQRQLRVIAALIWIFLLGASLSTVFTHHLPLSLEKYLFYLVAMGVWWWSLRWPLRPAQRQALLEFLALLSLVLNAFVLVIQFVPLSHALFQGMNLLVRSYGHNHYAALLLLVLPLWWWRLLCRPPSEWLSDLESLVITGLLLLSSYALLLLSMGRVALVIGFVQLLAILFCQRRAVASLLRRKLVGVLLKLFLLLFASASAVFVVLSLPLGEQDCPWSVERKDLCIAAEENSRLDYYRKAWAVLGEHPWFGYGLKTFNFASRQHPDLGWHTSSYAHNIFLHNLAEMGLVGGGSFIVLIVVALGMTGVVVWRRLCSRRHTQPPLIFFLFLGVLASFVNAMFDFDWHFFVIFTLTLIFMSWIWQEESAVVVADRKRAPSTLWSRWLLLCLALCTTAIAVGYGLASYWQHNNDTRWQQFVFFDRLWRMPPTAVEFDKQLQQRQLATWYSHDPDMWTRYLRRNDLTSEDRLRSLLILAKLDPSFFARTADFSLLDRSQAAELLPVMMNTFTRYQMIDNTQLLDYWWQLDLAVQLLKLGNESFLAGELEQAAAFYQGALRLDQHVVGAHYPAFLATTDLDEWLRLVLLLPELSPQASGDFYRYMELTHQTVAQLFLAAEFDSLRQLLRQVLTHEPAAKYYLLSQLAELEQYQAERDLIYQEFDFE